MNKPSTQAARDSTSAALPHDWMTASLQEIADPTDKFSFRGGPFGSDLKSDDYTNEGVRILQLQDIGEGSFLDKSSVYTSSEKADELIASNIYPGDILLAKMTPVARCCIVPSTQRRYVMCSDGIRLSVDSTRFNREYIFHALNGPGFRREAESKSTGSTRGRIGLSELKAIHLPIPQLPEQQKIAAILTAVDDKLDVIARQIEATQTLKQGLMQTLFSRGVGTQDADGRWVPHTGFKDSELGEIPAGWEVATLNQCSKLIYRYPGFYGFEPLECGVPVVRGEHIKNRRLSTDWGNYWYVTDDDSKKFPKTILEEGDLVMAVRGTVGNFGVVGPEHVGAQISPNLIRISPNKKLVDGKFFFFQMDSSARALQKSYVQSQALPSLSASDIKGIPIPLPPIREQEKIGEILSAVDEKLRHLLDRKSLNEALKRGLMQRLLTGEWRVSLDAIAAGT